MYMPTTTATTTEAVIEDNYLPTSSTLMPATKVVERIVTKPSSFKYLEHHESYEDSDNYMYYDSIRDDNDDYRATNGFFANSGNGHNGATMILVGCCISSFIG